MRKLLVTSQRGGVGKTMTALNLAATAALTSRVLLVDIDALRCVSAALNLHGRPRQEFRSVGLDLPGGVWCGALPNLDIISPCSKNTSPEELVEFLSLLTAEEFGEYYQYMVIDAPPLTVQHTRAILGACNELLLVARPDPVACRNLTPFLKMVQRQRNELAFVFRGILLTLPLSEPPSGQCERHLRGQYPAAVLPEVVPYDYDVIRGAVLGQPVVRFNPRSPAAIQYRLLATRLGLLPRGGPVAAARPGPTSVDALKPTPPAPVPTAPVMPSQPEVGPAPVPQPVHPSSRLPGRRPEAKAEPAPQVTRLEALRATLGVIPRAAAAWVRRLVSAWSARRRKEQRLSRAVAPRAGAARPTAGGATAPLRPQPAVSPPVATDEGNDDDIEAMLQQLSPSRPGRGRPAGAGAAATSDAGRPRP